MVTVCTACNGRSPVRELVNLAIARGDLWGVCDRCDNTHRDPDAPDSVTDDDIYEEIQASRREYE